MKGIALAGMLLLVLGAMEVAHGQDGDPPGETPSEAAEETLPSTVAVVPDVPETPGDDEPAPSDEPETTDPTGMAADLLRAARDGRWSAAFGLGLMLLITGLRAIGQQIFPWLGTRIGGYALAFSTAGGALLGASLAAGGGVSLGLFGNAIGAGFAAIGIHTAVRDRMTADAADT